MAATCPKCGFQPLEVAECPRCGVEVARYRAEMAVAGAVARPVQPASEAWRPGEWAPTVTAAPARRPAGFWIRVVALLLDGLFLVAMQLVLRIVAWLVFGGGLSPRAVNAGIHGFNLVLGSLYPVIFHWQWGQTLGKMLMQIRVVTMAGGPLTLGQSVLRQIGYWISAFTLGIGYLMVGLRSDKRGLHDLIAGTRVERLA